MYVRQDLPSAGACWKNDEIVPTMSVVFVHGWRGHYLDTWTHTQWKATLPPRRIKTSLFDLLTADPGIAATYFSVKHSGGLIFSRSAVKDLAKYLANFLGQYVYPHKRPTVLIAHSLGGLICRRTVLDELDRLGASKLPFSGLLMFGTPNDGTALSKYPFSSIQKTLRDMQVDSDFLADLNAEWTERVVNGGHPSYDVSRRTSLLAWYCSGSNDLVVKSLSARAQGAIGEWKPIEKDHRGLTKALSATDLSYVTLKNFLLACNEAAENTSLTHAAESLASNIRLTTRKSQWTVEEEEHIRLLPARKHKDGVLRCDVVVSRKGGQASNRFRIAVRLYGVEAPAEAVDYNIVVGKGLLDAAAYAQVADGIRSERLKYLARVTQLSLLCGGSTHTFTPESVETGSGFLIATFYSPTLPDGGRFRYDALALKMRTYIKRAHGYYTYYSPRTVLDKLVVDLRAPFPVAAIPLTHGQSKVAEIPTGSDHVAQVTVTGPVPVNSKVIWIFGGINGQQKRRIEVVKQKEWWTRR